MSVDPDIAEDTRSIHQRLLEAAGENRISGI